MKKPTRKHLAETVNGVLLEVDEGLARVLEKMRLTKEEEQERQWVADQEITRPYRIG